MKKMNDTFSSWMNAITFAEAGEFDTARQMMPAVQKKSSALTWFDRVFMSATFAEAGLPEEALKIMAATNEKPVESYVPADFLEAIGLKGVRITYGIAPFEAI